MNRISQDLVALMNDAIERELGLGADAEELVRIGIHRRRVQLASLRARDRGELVESCDRRPHEKILAEDVPSRPWPELERQAREIHARLVERVGRLSDDELLDEEPWREIGESPVWRQLQFTAVRLAAVSEYLRDAGDADQAIRLNEELRDGLRASALPPTAAADAIYNLACLYAGCDRTQEAVDALAEALRLNPDLVEWSRKDRDLEPIRGEEVYAQLVA